MSELPTPLFFGYTLEAAGPLRPAPVPGNYRRPESIARREAELAAVAAVLAPAVPTVGTLASWCLLNRDGAAVAGAVAMTTANSVSVSLFRVLGPAYPVAGRFVPDAAQDLWSAAPRGNDVPAPPRGFRLFGLDVATGLRVAALEALATSDTVPVPVGLYRDLAGVCDPYLTLLPAATARSHVGPLDLCRYLGYEPLGDEAAIRANPPLMAETARQLAIRGRLFEIE